MQSWENGLYICADCHGEFEQDELEQVDGGVEPVWKTVQIEGRGPEMIPSETEFIRVGVCVCPDCLKKRIDATAIRLLSGK